MEYNIQNFWVSGLGPSPGIQNLRKQRFGNWICVRLQVRTGNAYSVRSLRKSQLQWLGNSCPTTTATQAPDTRLSRKDVTRKYAVKVEEHAQSETMIKKSSLVISPIWIPVINDEVTNSKGPLWHERLFRGFHMFNSSVFRHYTVGASSRHFFLFNLFSTHFIYVLWICFKIDLW
jgi:hypothetical protein